MDALVLFRNRFFHLPQRPSEHVGESCVLARGGLFSGSPFRVDVGFHLSSPPGASGVPPLPQNLPGAGLQEELSRILILPEGGFVPQVMPNSVCRWFGGSQVGRHLPPLPPPLLGREPRVLLDTESHTGHPPPAPQMSLVPKLRNPILEALPPSQYRSKGPLSRDVFWERAPSPPASCAGLGIRRGRWASPKPVSHCS